LAGWVSKQAGNLDDNQSVTTTGSRADLVRSLEQFPAEFKRTVLDIATREQLLQPAFDGGWGIVEIIPHLRDWEEIYFNRIKSILQENRPALPSFDDTLWSIERDYRSLDPYESFDHFAERRSQTVELLRSATPEEWDRIGVHGYYGDITLLWLAGHIAEHDAEHLQQSQDALTV